ATNRATGVSHVLTQQVAMRREPVPNRIPNRDHPQHGEREESGSLAPFARKIPTHFLAIFRAKRTRIQEEQQSIHQGLPGANPLSRASFTNCARRRASAFATVLPKAVMR